MLRPQPSTCWPVAGRLLRTALLALAPSITQANGAASPAAPAPAPAALKLHVPSPDWRDQVIYMVMTDRFDDGDPRNNDQGAGEYKPGSTAHYQGGDLAGLQRRLDYIQGLGATALWVTPPVANLWWAPQSRFSGYHGYWAEHFAQVDKHLGTLADYQALSHALHSRGMYLVQDIVVNHTGDFFHYSGQWQPADPAAHWQPNAGTLPMARPSQAPFDRNDPRDPAQRREAIYHWTPDVRDHSQRQQELTFQMSGLDDLNTESPAVRRVLRQSYGHWIREAGVDAFRVDTALYVPPDFFADFMHSTEPGAPGVMRVARQTGRNSFFVFGEGFAIDKPLQSRQAARLERYVRSPGGQPLMHGMLNFPLYGSLGQVLARGAPAAELGHRITQMLRVHSDPHRMPSFIDNHDVDRFLAGGSEAGLGQALLALMTLPGIPVIYYGTEQGFTEQRASMFAAGEGSGGRDRFDTQAPLYRLIQQLTTLRRSHPLFSRGRPTVLQAEANGPGVLAWRMQHGRQAALVVLNTADRPTLLAGLATGAPGGSALQAVFSLTEAGAAATTDGAGRLTQWLPARSGQVWLLPEATALARAAGHRGTARPAPPTPQLRSIVLAQDGDSATAQGLAPPGAEVKLAVDGQLDPAATATADAQGRWQARLDTSAMVNAQQRHQVVAWLPEHNTASASRWLRVPRVWQQVADVADPAGDDTGRNGRTTYPTDAGWGAHRQMDIRRLQVWRAGGALRIALDMHRTTRSWNPPNEFDRVAFTLFLGRPEGTGQASSDLMPQQNGALPAGMRWQRRLRVHGWSNALFSAEGASAEHEGSPISPSAALAVDPRRHRVQFTLPASALGDLARQAGLQLYLNTWDWDNGYRELQPQASGFAMGGGPGPKVMDELGPVVLR